MKAKIVTELQKYHLSEKSFVYITYGSREYDIFITKINTEDKTIEFIGNNELKLSSDTNFFIGKIDDKKLKMLVI